ncbi:hypothetical protein BaRGS_00000187, partial [Batillaria attramentaria]
MERSDVNQIKKDDTADEEPTESQDHCQSSQEYHRLETEVRSPEHVRKKRPLEDKICRVCGDKALAHNFDVITCESCKAFFRRNALRREELRECVFQRSCPINMRTRRFCSACRLKKCFDIGMRADMIVDEGRRQAKLGTPLQKRTKRESPVTSSCNASSNQPTNGYCDQNCAPYPDKEGDGSPTQNGDYNTENSYRMDKGSPYPNGREGGYLSVPKGRRFEPVLAHQLPSDPHMYWRLTEDERALLTQISATYQNTILRLPQQGGASERTERAVNSITLEDLLGRCDVCANNVVKLMKGLADYRKLQVEDQLAALKACAMRTLILKGAACFVVERDAWIKAYGELPVSLFVRVTGHEKLIRQHAEFCRSLK